jgi:flavin-dependent dehydrogenase
MAAVEAHVSEREPVAAGLRPGETVQIAGAGPAGLAAAITLARAGAQVMVHEAWHGVGHRFQGDLQGLENWSTEQDVLDVLKDQGMSTDFATVPCRQGTAFDAWGNAYEISSPKPIFYLVERGPGPGTLDTALLKQAQALGVEVRFNSRLDTIVGHGILAIGPRAADVIAVGYHFETTMEDGFWVICDKELAPQGYAYLLVMNGWGTVKTCMFSGFKQEQLYVQRTVETFERLVGLAMINPKPHGGVGNFRIPVSAMSGSHPVVGEQAGFQDTLWGFGMRLAITSGVLAAQSLLHANNYDTFWRRELGPLAQTSVVNRAIFSLLGNRGYRWFFRHVQSQPDVRAFLRRQYQPSLWKRLAAPWANRYYESHRKDASCDHVDCSCVWCRCGQNETR